jgi:type IV secretory pathway VirJ component
MNRFLFFIFLLLTVVSQTKATDYLINENKGCATQSVHDNGNIMQLTDSPNTNLPLTIIPVSMKNKLPLIFFISGDGGWTAFDQGVSEILVANGMPVIGLNSRKYFWNEKQPKKVADEISVVIEYYMKLWDRNSIVLVGYSFGACVSPFIIPEFVSPLKESLSGIYCYSPDETGDFKIHMSDLLNIATNQKYDVLGQMKKIKSWNPVCIFGDEEDPDEQSHFSGEGIKVEILRGDHHYNKNYKAVADVILRDFLNRKP